MCGAFPCKVGEVQMETKSWALLLQQKYQTTGRNSPKLGNLFLSLKFHRLLSYNEYTVAVTRLITVSSDSTIRGPNKSHRGRQTSQVAPNLFEAVTLHEGWHVLSCVFISELHLSLELCVEPVRPPRGRFWRRSIISNGSGSHNGGTLSDLLGMHCGRQRAHFDLGAHVHRSVPCLKTDLLPDISLP